MTRKEIIIRELGYWTGKIDMAEKYISDKWEFTFIVSEAEKRSKVWMSFLDESDLGTAERFNLMQTVMSFTVRCNRLLEWLVNHV